MFVHKMSLCDHKQNVIVQSRDSKDTLSQVGSRREKVGSKSCLFIINRMIRDHH